MRILILLVLISIIVMPISLAATIHGIVYDISLNPIKNIIVEINTHPAQRLVSKTGAYSFEVPKGEYIITSRKTTESEPLDQEKINVSELEGNLVVDLFVFPEIEEKPKKIAYWLYILGIVIIIIIIIIFKKYKKKPNSQKEEIIDKDIEKVIQIIKSNNGRITQKELRKHFPLSEAKISLLISDLEKQGKLEKIKKGRGNILILK